MVDYALQTLKNIGFVKRDKVLSAVYGKHNASFTIGCHGKYLEGACQNLMSGKLDTGLTYSNSDTRETVMVFAKTSSAKEFQQSYKHETGHLQTHIAQSFGIDPYGEELQYIGDDIIDATWEIAKDLLCEHCRKH